MAPDLAEDLRGNDEERAASTLVEDVALELGVDPETLRPR